MIQKLPNEVNSFLTNSEDSIEDYVINSLQIESSNKIDKLRKIVSDIFMNQVKPYYDQREIIVNNAVYNFLLEPLKNSNFHGGDKEKHTISLELFLYPLSLAASYGDNGLYFTRSEVKQHWENRIAFTEKNYVPEKQIGYGLGTPLIYEMADIIHIDISTGTLYIGLSTKGRFFDARN